MQAKNLTLIAAVAIAAAFSCDKQPSAEGPQHLQVGDSVPAFQVVTITGQTISNKTLEGKRSLIIFFSTTCPDCHEQLPYANKAMKVTGSGMNFIAVACDEGPEAVASFWKQAKLSIPVAAPGDRAVYDLFDRGSGTGVPQVYILDKDGTVVDFSDDKKLMDVARILGPGYEIEDIHMDM